jgi:hypothetical protein
MLEVRGVVVFGVGRQVVELHRAGDGGQLGI